MRSSIFLKVSLAFFSVILLLSSLLLLFSFRSVRSFSLSLLEDDLGKIAIALSSSMTPLLEENRVGDMDSLVKALGKATNTRITVVAKDGSVLADSENDPSLMENHGARSEVRDALAGKYSSSIRYSTTMGEDMMYVAIPLQEGGGVVGALRVSVFFEEVHGLLTKLELAVISTGILVVLASLAGAFLFSRSLSRRIRELSTASKRLSEGDFGVTVPRRGHDELSDLAEGFNHMARTMKTLFDRVSGQKEELDSILSSIQEGLVVLDRTGKIVLTNRSFRDLVRDEHIEGRMYWELLREPEFGGLVEQLRRERGNLVRELEMKGKILLTSAAHLGPSGEIIVMLHDVTDIRRLERIKKDFVVNVSHELRTPLTVIKGFAETLEDETSGEQRDQCRTIVRHTDRLVSIVNDLLLLSELEEKGTQLQLEDVDLGELLAQVVGIFRQKLDQKGLEATLLVPPGVPAVKGDVFRLEQMFINLIDNAVKYTERGGITIKVKLLPGEIAIEVSDTGLGIPEEHQPRIFERFYVADRSRSRKLGGTGLGLSIVKHIVMLHGGRISVESQPGRGTTFTIILPHALPITPLP
jgi:two-component system phosphate regulon sensor histidine kinase PhoR